ncbi:hypothetical protein VspSTUT11_14970 [Vibrio sp. STUT-A11]|nr:hypothetical protein VspSTUT11_14970 [Vibrio sp. STUT-A11]
MQSPFYKRAEQQNFVMAESDNRRFSLGSSFTTFYRRNSTTYFQYRNYRVSYRADFLFVSELNSHSYDFDTVAAE